jgi:hypothetical protein
MKITYPKILVTGLETSEQFVPVQTGTGLLISSGSVRVTGAQTQATILEVRRSPARTVEVSAQLEPESQTRTALFHL